jgi:Cys-rich protein (TIGR01571 family)
LFFYHLHPHSSLHTLQAGFKQASFVRLNTQGSSTLMSSPPSEFHMEGQAPQLPPPALQPANGRTYRQESSQPEVDQHEPRPRRSRPDGTTRHNGSASSPTNAPENLIPSPADPRSSRHHHEHMVDKHRRLNQNQPVNQQPQAQPEMRMNSRNALNKPVDEEGQRNWSYGLHDYIDKAAVWRAALLPCVVYARNARRYDHLDRHDAPHPAPGNDSVPQCLGHACATLCCFSWCLCMSQRGKVRERYNIGGDMGDDLAESCVCYPCALHQEERELALEEQTLQDNGVDPKEFWMYQTETAPRSGVNCCTPVSGDIGGGNGCACCGCLGCCCASAFLCC